jgi:glycosyltransferase involved in cell wall biosynthesis
MRFLEAAGALGPGPMVLVPFRVTRRKRLELAIRAVAALGGRRRGLRLVVSGPLGPHSVDNDDYWDELVELRRSLGMEGTVVFLREHGQPHPVDDQMVAELYQLASAVLLTSESEGFGLPVLEAGIARVPVICSDLEVFREVVDDEAYRFAVDATPEEVAERLEEGLDSNVARLLVRIGDRYDWGSVLPRIEEEIRLAVA